jgi:N-acetylglutamate synthase-like GNAT family acetyltransferase
MAPGNQEPESPMIEEVGFVVRDATLEDLPRLGEVFRLSALSNPDDRRSMAEHPEALVFPATSLTDGRVRVATVEPDLIVGFATTVVEVDFLELVDLFTHPDWMRRRAASTLIDDVVVFATGLGISRISVIGNLNAMEFYRRVGFVAEGLVPTQFGKGLRMHLELPRRI